MSVVCDVTMAPARKRAVPLKNDGVIVCSFPDLWFTSIASSWGREQGHVYYWHVITTKRPTLDESVLMMGGGTCLGDVATQAWRRRQLPLVEAYFSTRASAEVWQGHADYWTNDDHRYKEASFLHHLGTVVHVDARVIINFDGSAR